MTQKVTVSEIAGLVEEATRIRQTGEIPFVEFLNRHTLEGLSTKLCTKRPEYRSFWEDTHFSILGETYEAKRHENFDFDLAQMIECPYPYITKEPSIIAQQVRDWANVLEAIDLPQGSRILEMGAGWKHESALGAKRLRRFSSGYQSPLSQPDNRTVPSTGAEDRYHRGRVPEHHPAGSALRCRAFLRVISSLVGARGAASAR